MCVRCVCGLDRHRILDDLQMNALDEYVTSGMNPSFTNHKISCTWANWLSHLTAHAMTMLIVGVSFPRADLQIAALHGDALDDRTINYVFRFRLR